MPIYILTEFKEKTFLKLGISALAINEDTLASARACDEDLWEKAITGVTLLLLSPEQLSLRSFNNLLQKKVFWKRIAGLGLDESHLVLDWENSGFREALRQIGLVLACLPPNTVRNKVLSSGPQGQRQPRAGVAVGGLDQKGSVCPTEVVKYEIP
jgi:superfamily II DNA helicase RecQ